MSLINSTAIPSGAGYEIDQSLRFEDGSSAYLSRTPSSASNRKTWTFSAWIKRGNLGVDINLLHAYAGSGQRSQLVFATDDTIKFDFDDYTANRLTTTQKFRDVSAWYHIVLAVDTTQGTAANRVKIYVNGNQITDFSAASYPSQNEDGHINEAIQHEISSYDGSGSYLDGYLGEVNFIDGAAKAPADFGEFGDYGEWKPIAYSGSYGTNGFYLPFKQDYTVEGFSTVLSTGNATAKYVGGVGFQPDFVWNKTRSANQNHFLYDAIRGTGKELRSNQTNAEGTNDGVTAFHPDGFSRGTSNDCNENGITYVDWCWDMGGSNATNTEGSIQSTVRANPTYGQSIVSYTGNGSANQTVGHGLSAIPELVIIKAREYGSGSWTVYHSFSSGNPSSMFLNSTGATESGSGGTSTTSVIGIQTGTATGGDSTNRNNEGFIAYCFHSVTGYSSIGNYSGSGGTGKAVTTGFKPAFVMIKRTDSAQSWLMFDNVRNPSNPVTLKLAAESSGAEGNPFAFMNFTSTGFTLLAGNDNMNASGGSYIYMAFADKREYAYWLDQSGNNNDWTSNNLTESDVMLDSPTNNFATMNPLYYGSKGYPVFAEGNLKISKSGTFDTVATFGMKTGSKYYMEMHVPASKNYLFRLIDEAGGTYGSIYNQDGSIAGTTTTLTGKITGISVDRVSDELKIYVNNSLDTTLDISSAPSNLDLFLQSRFPWTGGDEVVEYFNFGQDSSFAGNKTAQGNQDGNSIGDFYYTPPSGFLALCTKNLPDVAVVPSEHFNTVLWTGNDTARTISGVGFQPDFTWIRNREIVTNHLLFDAIRGAKNALRSNLTNVESTNASDELLTFASDGFTLGTGEDVNGNAEGIVAWNWKAGNATLASNAFTQGSIASTCSRNVDAGFSIVSYTGNDTAGATVGHGLSSALELIIIKNRDRAVDWIVWHDSLADDHHLKLQGTHAAINSSTRFNSTDPSSTLFTLGNQDDTNKASDKFIAYCFHSVDGYSKVGSYEGNDDADGTFVYTGFRPAFVMVKNIDDGYNWIIADSTRETHNSMDFEIYPNLSNVEHDTSGQRWDFVSNGIKLRSGSALTNEDTYIYIAFAETPFKYSNAR